MRLHYDCEKTKADAANESVSPEAVVLAVVNAPYPHRRPALSLISTAFTEFAVVSGIPVKFMVAALLAVVGDPTTAAAGPRF